MDHRRPRRRFMTLTLTLAALFLEFWLAPASPPAPDRRDAGTPTLGCDDRFTAKDSPELTAETIIDQMLEANRRRDRALQRYTATRHYQAENFRLKKRATLQAQVQFESPALKQFTVLSEEGSDVIRKTVFRGMMDGEIEALEPEMKRRSAISTANYRFKLLGKETLGGRPCYALQAEPKRKDKFLFRGRLWIDACDFAVMRIQGSPAKMPSIWTRKVELEREYQKLNDFWLPSKDEAESQLLIFGKSRVLVEHSNYQIEGVAVSRP